MSPERPSFLIFLHGFKSSPASFKARYLDEFLSQRGCGEQIVCPELNPHPAVAIKLLREKVEERLGNYNITLIGSSLGGYYATFLTETYGIKSVLINPAVAPFRMMAENLGVHQNYHTQQEFEITHQDVSDLEQLEVPELVKFDQYLVFLQTGDETLDYREAAQKYANSNPVIEQGGSHGFDHFERVVPRILAFAGIEIL